jgi:hypothetical protein
MHFDKLKVDCKEMTHKYEISSSENKEVNASNTKYRNMFTEHEQKMADDR